MPPTVSRRHPEYAAWRARLKLTGTGSGPRGSMRVRPEGHDRRCARDHPAQRPGRLGGLLSRVRSPAVRDSSRVAAERLAPRMQIPRSTFYGEGRTPLSNEELTEIENAGRRCAVCRSGRGWRRFEVVRPAEGEPIVLCGSCRARFGDDPPVGRKLASPVVPVPAAAEPVPRRSPARTRQRPASARIACGRLWTSCPARSRRRWPLGQQV